MSKLSKNSKIKAEIFILEQLVRQYLVLKYRRTVFGYMWTLFNPILMMSVTALVFSNVMGVELKTYAIFLFAGILPFNYFSNSVTQQGQTLINNEGLIKKINIPRILFPLATSLAVLIDNSITMTVLIGLIYIVGGKFGTALLFLPISYFLLFLFSLGIGLAVSIANVYVRDLQYIINNVMQALIFISGVYFKPNALQGKVAWLIDANPLSKYVALFRIPIYEDQLPSLALIGEATCYSVISLMIGILIFAKFKDKISFRL